MVTLVDIKNAIKEKGKYWIVFTGDSITSCEWVHPNWREIVEYVLKDKLAYDWGLKTFNFAYDGGTSKDLVNRLPEILKVDPDLVLTMIGGNDPFLSVSVSDHTRNVKILKDRVEANRARFVYSTDNNPLSDYAQKKYSPYVDADRKLGLPANQFIDLYRLSDKFPKERIYTFVVEDDIPVENIRKGDLDYWHPNQLGNAYIAKVMLKEIFGIEFDPEKFWQETLAGEKLPRY